MAALALFLATPAHGLAASSCAVEGDPIHWIADVCMSKLGTDDEIAAMDCISEELRRPFSDDCAAKHHYKRMLCELAVANQTFPGTIETCRRDKEFMGYTVRNGGIGN